MTCLIFICCVVVSRRSHRYVSFLRLAYEEIILRQYSRYLIFTVLDNRKSADTYQTLEEKFLKIQEADPDEVAADTIETVGETAKTDKTDAEKSESTITTRNTTETTTEDTREEKKDWWFTDVRVAFDELLQNSLIETGIHPESSDHILTLSTCTGNGYDSRMTVHAVCIDEQTTDPEKLF